MRTGVLIFSALCLLVAGCTASPPSQVDNICRIFEEKRSWHRDVKKSAQKWKSSVPIIMAIIYQESRFRADAKPPRRRILGFIPGPRPSDAYGYSQALEDTWNSYRRQTGQRGADRDKFKDAVDFIGWYNQGSVTRLGIARQDAYRLYLAYHEGWGGYARRTWQSKPWLPKVARKVEQRAATYKRQLRNCPYTERKKWRWLPF